ncbi:MAG: EAL domain-containing protein [Actinomycetota bacterium]
MGLGVRARMFVWILLVILPAFVVGWFTVSLIDARLSDRVAMDLTNIRRLEAARIDQVLDDYVADARSLAAGPHVIDFTNGVNYARAGWQTGEIGGYDGFRVIDPSADRPLDQLADALQDKAKNTGSEVVELRLVGLDGSTLGETARYSWEPYDSSLADQVLTDGQARFGNAFRSENGYDRLGLVTPIRNNYGAVIGVLVLETNLGPVVDLLVEHEGFGQTTEAHIAQLTPDGDAEFITRLRFDRDAAFNKIVPSANNLPINQSLSAPDGLVLESPDYRATDSILSIGTIETTGWGLVVKMDAAEAYAPVHEVRQALAFAGLVTMILIIGCTAVLLNPLGDRLRRLSVAAKEVAGGNYRSSIGDTSGDEIGVLARSIDQLAADLDTDIKMRTAVESRLRHQATHDDLTGIHNRHYATDRIRELVKTGASDWSLLFLDLDNFKGVNDTYGHGVGDEVLQAVAGRLSASAPANAMVARWGGDEFVVVLPGTTGEAAEADARQTRELFFHPMATSAGELSVRCSVGLATADNHEATLDQVLRHADSAMFAEKPKARTGRRAWSKVERIVVDALHNDRVHVWYQPIFRSEPTGPTIAGAEALVRLQTTDGMLIPPAEFLPAVVDREPGINLDAVVATKASEICRDWLRRGLVGQEFLMSVNLGAGSLTDPGLGRRFRELLGRTGIAPHMLLIEISEMAERIDGTVLRQLADLGVNLALDDVGISHSNYDRLLALRPGYAKIDHRWLTTTRDESLILESLTKACAALSLTMVAEGIETPAQQQLAERLGIPYLQGFLFGRAVPAEEFATTWLGAPGGSNEGGATASAQTDTPSKA